MTWQELREEWLSDSPGLLCHTSGSTGTPKSIMLPKEQVAASARRTISFFSLGKGARLHSCLAPDYIGGKMMMIRALLCDGKFSYEKPSNRPLRDWDRGRIDMLCVVPSQLADMVTRTDELPAFGAILVGGAPVPENLRLEIARTGLPVWETYGMTETASHVAIRKVTEPESLFTPLPGITLSNPDGNLVIDIAGWKRFITNDVAELHTDGSFRIIGRSDNAIITGGLKVHPEEVERKLQSVFHFPLMISSEADQKWGRRVVLITENPDIPDAEIMDRCHTLLQRHEVPKQIVHTSIPRTPNGKIKRNWPTTA